MMGNYEHGGGVRNGRSGNRKKKKKEKERKKERKEKRLTARIADRFALSVSSPQGGGLCAAICAGKRAIVRIGNMRVRVSVSVGSSRNTNAICVVIECVEGVVGGRLME